MRYNILLLLLLLLPLKSTYAQDAPRVKVTINEAWRYWSGPAEGAAYRDYDDSDWAEIALPHTWNTDDAFDEKSGYRRGIGWYRKRLLLDPTFQDKRLYLYFEGANQVADVFVNGHHVGQHIGGYTAFAFDITEAVTFDAANIVAVRRSLPLRFPFPISSGWASGCGRRGGVNSADRWV